MRCALPGIRRFRSKNCRRLVCLRLFRPRFSDLSAASTKVFRVAAAFTEVQTARRSRDGRIHFHRAGPRRKDARHSDFHSRIQRDSRKSEPLTARMVRAVLLGFKECAPFFPKVHTEVTGTPIRDGTPAPRSKGRAAKTRAAGGYAHDSAGHGRKPGRERDQSGDDQIIAVPARGAPCR